MQVLSNNLILYNIYITTIIIIIIIINLILSFKMLTRQMKKSIPYNIYIHICIYILWKLTLPIWNDHYDNKIKMFGITPCSII